MAATDTIRSALDEGVLTVGIHRPDKRNAITSAMYQGLADAMERAAADAGVRVILLRGEPDIFTSGNDIVDFLERPPTSTSDPVFQFLQRIIGAGKPVVAAVNGAAVGIGTTMLLHCDVVVAGEGAYFSVPFVNLGLCPEAGSSLMLPVTLGLKRAAELLFFGERIDARKALDWGLVNAVVPDAKSGEVALERARILAAKPAEALRTSKALLKRQLAVLAQQAMVAEAHEFGRLLATPAAREALSAFVGKRAPDTAKFK